MTNWFPMGLMFVCDDKFSTKSLISNFNQKQFVSGAWCLFFFVIFFMKFN